MAYALFETSSRNVKISCEKLLEYNKAFGDSLNKLQEHLSGVQETLQEDFHLHLEKLKSALEAAIKYEIMPKHDKIEACLRDRASQSEQDALQFEVFELTSPLSCGYYTPEKFYGELTQLLDQASRIEHPDEKQKAVKRLVNIGLGYARCHLPPTEYQVPLLLEFSKLGYKPEELREMVILK